MENFLFTLSASQIYGLEANSISIINRSNINNYKIGGLLIFASRPSDDSNATEFKVFMVLWDVSSIVARLVIPGVVSNFDTEAELIGALNRSIPSSEIAMLNPSPTFTTVGVQNNRQNTTNPANYITPNARFNLAFVDKVIYEEMLTNTGFYYKEGENYYINAPGQTQVRVPLNANSRGLNFYAAMSTIYHGLNTFPDPGIFTTLIVRPNPEPQIVDLNAQGAVAYVSIPSCPPYWKPATQFIYSIPGMVSSASRAMQSAATPEDNSQNKLSNWERLVWLLIILILIFIATCKKI